MGILPTQSTTITTLPKWLLLQTCLEEAKKNSIHSHCVNTSLTAQNHCWILLKSLLCNHRRMDTSFTKISCIHCRFKSNFGHQSTIVQTLQLKQSLHIFVAFIRPSHDPTAINQFKRLVNNHRWKLSKYVVSFRQSGDSINGHSHITISIHRSSAPRIRPIMLKTIPHLKPRPLSDFIYIPFNKIKYSVFISPND